MVDYKENTDVLEEKVKKEQTESTLEDSFVGADDKPVDVEGLMDSDDLNDYTDEVVTAVLLIKNKQGAILPITKLDNLKMEKQANAHEVLRMCADVQDQISAIRIVGELAQIFDNIQKDSLKNVASLLQKKVDSDLGV